MERFIFPEPRYLVEQDTRLAGKKSKRQRQVDIAVREVGKSNPALIVEVKRYKRPVSLPVAGSIIALVQDVGHDRAVMVSAAGFSVAAKNHLDSESIAYITITLKEANALRWIPVIEERFAVDRQFKEASGQLLEALRRGEVSPFLDSNVPYEEWLAVIACGENRFPEPTWNLLKSLARQHHDDGVRYNAIMILIDAGQLKKTEVKELAAYEQNPEVLEILNGRVP